MLYDSFCINVFALLKFLFFICFVKKKFLTLIILGCFTSPPYVDEYLETDQGLVRGNPLHLCLARYEELHELWLSHNIPEHVSHRMEQSTTLPNWPMLWQNYYCFIFFPSVTCVSRENLFHFAPISLIKTLLNNICLKVM